MLREGGRRGGGGELGTVARLAGVAGRLHGQAEGYQGTVLIPEVKVQQLLQEGQKQ